MAVSVESCAYFPKVDYTAGSGPGVWQPTPAAYTAASGTQLGRVKPFVLQTADQ